jgi:RNA polymerase subunit RPABC4/transcription elongation factor Spt4
LSQSTNLATSNDKGSLVWFALVAALVLAAALGATLLLLLKKRSEVIARAEEQAENRAAKALEAVTPPLPAQKACPECGRTYEADASFCPHDRSRLIELKAFTDTSTCSPGPTSGMVCPRCHRGYEADARFCPHDAEALIAYSEWKVTRRSKAPRSS